MEIINVSSRMFYPRTEGEVRKSFGHTTRGSCVTSKDESLKMGMGRKVYLMRE